MASYYRITPFFLSRLLDKLGMSAKMGLDVVMRAALYGSDYTMLDLDNLDPKPVGMSSGPNFIALLSGRFCAYFAISISYRC